MDAEANRRPQEVQDARAFSGNRAHAMTDQLANHRIAGHRANQRPATSNRGAELHIAKVIDAKVLKLPSLERHS